MSKDNTIGGFEQFIGTNMSRLVDKITITKGSHFNLPTAMYRKNSINKFKFVKLFYNKKDSQIGFEFTNIQEPEDGSLKLVPSGDKGQYGAYIVAKSFFFMNSLKPEKLAGRYDYAKKTLKSLGADRPGFMYVIDLKKEAGKI